MPHVIIEHSPNLAERIDVAALVHSVHVAALGSGIVPADGLRTRALAAEHAEVADGDPGNVYVAVTARLGPGRNEEEQQGFLQLLVDTVLAQLGDVADDTALSVEYQQIDPKLRMNRNGLRRVS